MKLWLLTAISMVLSAGYCLAGETLNMASDQDKISYSIGYQVGGDFKRQAVELRPEMMVKGIQDAMTGGEPQLTPEQMRDSLIELKKRADAAQKTP